MWSSDDHTPSAVICLSSNDLLAYNYSNWQRAIERKGLGKTLASG
jgi:hypothetical protein